MIALVSAGWTPVHQILPARGRHPAIGSRSAQFRKSGMNRKHRVGPIMPAFALDQSRDTKPPRAPVGARAVNGSMQCGPVAGRLLSRVSPRRASITPVLPLVCRVLGRLLPWLARVFFLLSGRCFPRLTGNRRRHALGRWLVFHGQLQ